MQRKIKFSGFCKGSWLEDDSSRNWCVQWMRHTWSFSTWSNSKLTIALVEGKPTSFFTWFAVLPFLKHTFWVEDLFVLCIWRHFLLLLHIILQALGVGWLYVKHHRCMRAEAKGSGCTEHPCLQLRPLSLTTPRPQPKETTSRLRDAHILHLQHICQATSERYVSCWLCLLH